MPGGIRSESHAALLSVARTGLPPRSGPPKKVVIVGAGMAGLVAASELARAGHEPVVLEARARVGGRVHTLREPFTDGLYAEAGAMRIPRTHDLTLAYCERFGLPLTPFTASNPNAYVHLGGQRWRRAEVQADPCCLPFTWSDGERGRTVDALWTQAVAGFAEQVSRDGDTAWAAIAKEWDHCSTREFLEHCKWSEGAIEAFGLLEFQEALMNSSFLELLREEVTRCYVDLVEIAGGMDRLPTAFLPELRPRIRFGAKMVALDQDERSATVHYQTPAGRFRETGDHVLVTVPFPVLRHVETLEALLAREAAGHPAAPLRRLGEDPLPVPAAVLGGGRGHPRRGDGHGPPDPRPLLSGPRPGDGARRPPGELHVVGGRAALGLACRRPTGWPRRSRTSPPSTRRSRRSSRRASRTCGTTTSSPAAPSRSSTPASRRQLYEAIVKPEGRIHFAGEHASRAHAWIQGAIESGLRAALEINGVRP